MTDKTYNVLFLCTGNSARSILAEAVMDKLGAGRFKAWSAGSQPKGEVHPMALSVLENMGFDTSGMRSKSWNEFSRCDAPEFDFIFTVCDNAAGETCPVWPGRPVSAHWGIEDPATVEGDGQRVTGLVYTDRATGESRRVALAGVFVQIGLVPNTDWLRGTLQLSARGEIEVDARGQTSVPGVFAAGDATTVPFKQIVIAMGEGAKAALGAFDHLIRTPLAAIKASVSFLRGIAAISNPPITV